MTDPISGDPISADLQFFQRAIALRHQRQDVLAGNIANADTPNYKARDMDFGAAMKDALRAASRPRLSNTSLAQTSPRHIAGQARPAPLLTADRLLYRQPLQPSLDGNTVDMDVERVLFAENTTRLQADMTLISHEMRALTQAVSP